MENANPGSERDERLKKLEALKEKGLNPYPAKSNRNISVAEVLASFDDLNESQKELIIGGRLRTLRTHGNLTFANLQDGKDQIQIAISKKEVGDEAYKLFIKFIDMGDFVEVRGACFTTHKGEKSVMAKKWQLLTKTLRPMPEKWHGLSDEDEKLRRRYLDIMLNREVYEMIEKRSKFWQATRNFLHDHGFLEVETPVLETTTGGADAKPFVTHHNALDIDVFLRISMGELWQKKLMVAGFPKTFEIGRQFRNEGMDAEHLQDYTQLEFYWAYADYEELMKFLEKFYRFVIKQTTGGLVTLRDGQKINWDTKWPRHDYVALFRKAAGLDPVAATEKELCQKALALRLKPKKNASKGRLIDLIYKKTVRPKLIQPSFLVNLPVEISPLAKKVNQNPQVTERILVMAGGTELGNGFSELNDPVDQRQRFEQQQKLREAGDEEAQMYDRDFVEALEYGMPPTAGFGLSERLFAFLLDKPIRETVLFPMMGEKK